MDGLPDDATGDTLRRLRNDGADLSKPHDINYYVAVRDQPAAENVSTSARQIGISASVAKNEEDSD